ncbi:hypothetical protein ACN27F_13680 [Solwaraspora sp. WMMB335]|uniref:hypothetical protein n=1 Tax=Solwaraspora sp. WMMB335 TaxID=3404118 RepID=UPI003B93088F
MGRGIRAVAAVLVGLLSAVVTAVVAAAPAAAHDRNLDLTVAGDGATGVTVQATHTDGHQLDTVIRLVLTATAQDGRIVGPLQLEPAGEGKGFYASGPVLTPGAWRVTVTAPAPYAGTATVDVRAAPAQSPPVAAAPPAESDGSPSVGAGWWRWWPAWLGVLVGAGLALAVPVARRRGTRRG